MFSAVVGHSEEADAAEAVEEILQQCRGRLAGSAPKAGLLFAAIDFDHQTMLCDITRAFPGNRADWLHDRWRDLVRTRVPGGFRHADPVLVGHGGHHRRSGQGAERECRRRMSFGRRRGQGQ